MLIFSAQYLVANKSMRFTPTITIAEVREDVVGKCVNMFRRISCCIITQDSFLQCTL